MGNTNLFKLNPTAVQQMINQVEAGMFCSFTTATYNIYNPLPVTPLPLLQKSVNVTIATRSEPQADITWMVIMTHRVDGVPHQPGKLELQADPALMLFRGEGLEPVVQGVVSRHQCFPGQNVLLPQFDNMEPMAATHLMRMAVKDMEKRPLTLAEPQVGNVLEGMIRRHGEKLLRIV
jgi:hypothetical protein